MSLKIMNVEERLKTHTAVKALVVGKSGIGKSSLLKTLDEPTLCIDFEAGLLSVQTWEGDVIKPQAWKESRDLICWICGPNPAMKPDQAYGLKHFERACQILGDPKQLDKYKNIFVDSITEATRVCMQWAEQLPAAFSERTGNPDKRTAYGILKSEMMLWLKLLQHVPNKNVILVGILDEVLDEFNRTKYALQCEGTAIARELPGIVDQVISMVPDSKVSGKRTFVCQTLNPWSLPAKDRSGALDMTESADLGKLFKKIKRCAPTTKLDGTTIPSTKTIKETV